MTATTNMLAFDLGAESGRGLLGRFDGRHLRLEEVRRFANGPVTVLDRLHWDVLRLWQEMLTTLGQAAADFGNLGSVGVDTWGVDFALLGRDDTLLGNPRHYRDPHTENIMAEAFRRVSSAEIFGQTGIQFMRFNTIFQLLALQRDRSPLLEVADSLLFMPDLFHFWLSGVKANEYTDASTSQLVDPVKRTWARDLLGRFALPDRILGTLLPPGSLLGPLRARVAASCGLERIPVIAPASHDTAAAVAAVPAQGQSWAYISSGTWSLMGVEISSPQLGEPVRKYNFTNEGGCDGTVRLLKNIMGLWLVQECRRTWDKQGRTHSYEELMGLAEQAPPFASLVNPDDHSFILPASMPVALGDFCRQTGQPVPLDAGAVVRCALESLALRYRWVLEKLEELVGTKIETIHVVGGGSQNTLLCQLTADACNRPVVAGPVEATAIGNVLVQAIGLRLLGSLAEAREVVRHSFDVRTYSPQHPDIWHEPYQRFLGYLTS